MDSTTAKQLLENAGWVRALARRLLRDPHVADDVAQEAWVRALRRPGLRVGSARAWLATVVRRLASTARRGDERRVRRERAAAAGEAEPATDELVARAEAQRKVVAAVLALDEPYRATLLQHYFDGLTAAAIARAAGVPAATVRSRLLRAHELLRGRLDREFGERAAWCAALSMLVKGGAGAAVLGVKAKVAVAFVVVAVSLGVLWRARGARDESTPRDAGGRTTPARADLATREAATGVSDVPPTKAATISIIGVVIDPDGARVKGARVLVLARGDTRSEGFDDFERWIVAARSVVRDVLPLAEARSDEEGRFVIAVKEGDVSVTAAADGFGPAAPIDLGAHFSSRAGADGSFVLPGVPPGRVRLLCRHPEYLPALVGRVTAPGRNVSIVLETGAELRGMVRDATMQPVPGARVTVFGIGNAPSVLPISATTGAGGRFTVRVPRLSQFSVMADAGPRGRSLLQAVHFSDKWRVEEIVLMAPQVVEGRVVLGDGSGVPGLAVEVWDVFASAGGSCRAAVSGADGRFRVEGAYARMIRLVDTPRFDLVRPIRIDDASTTVLVAPRGSVSGHVVDSDGRGVSGAEVTSRRAFGPAFTDPEGRFTLRGFRPGEKSRGVRARAPDGRIGRSETFRLDPGEHRAELRLVLREAKSELEFQDGTLTARGPGVVHGRVIDESGQPITGAVVRASRIKRMGTNTTTRYLGQARTAADGTFVLRGLGTEPVGLRFHHVDFGRKRVQDVALAAGEVRIRDVVLPAPRVLRGLVVDSAGQPIAYAQVRVRSREGDVATHTGARGEFVVRDLRGQRVSVRVHAHAYKIATVGAPVFAPQQNRIVLDPVHNAGNLSISGVILAADGARLPVAGVSAVPVSGGGRPRGGRTGMQGRFRIDGLAPGRYELRGTWHFAVGHEHDRFVFERNVVEAGADDVVVRLVEGLEITGRVIAPAGTDFSGTTVGAAFVGKPWPKIGGRRSAPVEADGRFRLVGLVAGDYRVELRSKTQLARPVAAVAAGTEGVEIVLRTGLSIAGTVVFPAGKRPRGLSFRAHRRNPKFRRRVPVDESGAFRLDGLAPGKYELHVRADGRSIKREIEAGNMSVRIVLEAK